MAFKFFTVPIQDAGAAEELNAFLRSQRVLAVERRWVERGAQSFWTFCIDYLEPRGTGFHSGNGAKNRGKVDYREVLNPEDFAVFVKLRDLRKQLAQAESVPVYTIFTNEQLAQIVRGKARTKADLGKIDGIGESRLEKGEGCREGCPWQSCCASIEVRSGGGRGNRIRRRVPRLHPLLDTPVDQTDARNAPP